MHLVDTGVDTGQILGQARITPSHSDNFATYGLLQQGAGLPLLKQAIRDICEDGLSPIQGPPGTSRLWAHPTLSKYVYHRLRFGVK